MTSSALQSIFADNNDGNGFIGDESDEEEKQYANKKKWTVAEGDVEEGECEEEEEDYVYRGDHGMSLEEIQRELLELAELSDAGYDIDEKRFDFLLQAQEDNPEYQAMLEEERANWRESLAEFLEQCLERTRTFVPVNIFDCTYDGLLALGLSDDLARRLLQRQCLWLVRMGKDEIARLHESDLLGRFNSQQQHLDIIETAAVYASLPDEFRVDPHRRKRDWKLTIEDNLRQMLLDNDQDALPIEKIRNPCYEGRQYGPITDVVTVRQVVVHKASDAREHRKSFLAVCKEHSLMGKMRALSSRRRSRSMENGTLPDLPEIPVTPNASLDLADGNVVVQPPQPPTAEDEEEKVHQQEEEIRHNEDSHVDQLAAENDHEATEDLVVIEPETETPIEGEQ